MSQTIKIVIVEDHEIFRDGLAMVLNRIETFELVGVASNGEEFLCLIETVCPDVILMDIIMPGIDGIAATEQALERIPGLKIIALSASSDKANIKRMLTAGAKGFLLKNTEKKELKYAIEMVHSGGHYYSSEILPYFTSSFTNDQVSNSIYELSKREIEVLELIAKGYSSSQIGEQLFISARTVGGHKENLFAKTGTNSVLDLLIFSIKNKLVVV